MAQTDDLEEQARDVLTEGWVHKMMLAFNVPEQWPPVVVWVVLLGLVAGQTAVTLLLTNHQPITLTLLGVGLFALVTDALILRHLTHDGLSFGPQKAQLTVLQTARLFGNGLVLFIGWFVGWQISLVLLIVGQLGATIALIWGAVIEPFALTVTELTIETDRWPRSAEPVRFLHITDLHVERLTKRDHQVAELAQKLKPEFIVITGDYVNLSYNQDPITAQQVAVLLGQIKAPQGVYATLGSPPVDLRETVVPIFDHVPHIQLMRHDVAEITLSNGQDISILGMDCTHDLPLDRKRFDRLVTKSDNSKPQLFLFHSPEIMPEVAEHGLDLYLCGHTHGGQVRLPLIGPILTSSQLGRRFVMGLYTIGRTSLYICRGLGLEGLSAPRVRFLAPPELVLITLKGK